MDTGFMLLEPPVYNLFTEDMDALVAYLEAIRGELPSIFTDLPDSVDYYLLYVDSPHGSTYPAIGLQISNEEDVDLVPCFLKLQDLMDSWLLDYGIHSLMEKAKQVDAPTWKELKKIRCYPQ